MNIPPAALGYVILYVEDVAAALRFYRDAFGLEQRFFNDEGGVAYGELETGATRLAFASLGLARTHFPEGITPPSLDAPPLGVEIALVTPDVAGVFARATSAGATPLSEPATKPWGQTVAYVRDNSGHLVEICTPMP